jgi:hypothetical protein
MFTSKGRAYQVKNLPGATLLGWRLTKFKLGWKNFQGTYTLSYYEHLQNMDVTSFITFGPGDIFKTFCFICYLRIHPISLSIYSWQVFPFYSYVYK